ncbi:MAG: hypothetical protein AAF553_09395 [Pseudomonadota bacterium]
MRIAVALFVVLFSSISEPVTATEKYEILQSYATQSESDNGSSGSSSGSSAWIETVHRGPEGCVEKSFDSVDPPGKTRPLAAWKLPVRVRQCGKGAPTIVNEDEMIARLEKFLEAVELTRDACGSYYFTWSVFQIDCDPQVALDLVKDVDLGAADISPGAEYVMPDNAGSAILTTTGGDHAFFGTGEIKKGFLRDKAAQTIKVLSELNGEKVSDEEALARLENHQFSGEFTVEFEIDRLTGMITRTLTTETRTVDANSVVETRKAIETTTRKRAESVNEPDPSVV